MSNICMYLVDDDEDFIKESKLWILDDDVDLKTFTSPVDALNSLSEETPDIVVTDVMMPLMNGANFSKLCLSILEHKNVIIISANTKDQIKSDLGIEIGKYFKKPLQSDFMDSIDSIIDQVRKDKKTIGYRPTEIDPAESRLKIALIQSFLQGDYREYQDEMFDRISHMDGSSKCRILNRLEIHKRDIVNYHNDIVSNLDILTWEDRLDKLNNYSDELKKSLEISDKSYPRGIFVFSYLNISKDEHIDIDTIEVCENDRSISYLLINGKDKIDVLVERWIDNLHMDERKEKILSRFICEYFFKNLK